MYSGSTLTKFSGRIMGAHQKIDRIARRHLEQLAPGSNFPSARQILNFEGKNGPDGIKRKSPAVDEPWHYFQPFDDNDTQLLDIIDSHYRRLVKSMMDEDKVRAAFEAAWLAHAVVDGLTPAHQYPYEEKLVELRGGQPKELRTTIRAKLIQPGETRRAQLTSNWRMWGPKGLMTTHGAFELGVATTILPSSLKLALPTEIDIEKFNNLSVSEWYRQVAQEVARLGLYDEFYKKGWTVKLGRRVRRELAPMIVRAVTVMWYSAQREAAFNLPPSTNK